ncbi:MAG: peroxiredoxin [Acholeplasmatales bacterium]|nr:peroxiredoxin [Acholeplasmatales bacterium]
MLNINDKYIDFELPDQNGKMHKLSDYLNKGNRIVLYFYPKDNTSGCTTQACGYSALVREFTKKNTIIFGISKDSVKSHKKFEENHDLKITLLSDESLNVLNAYDVYKEKSMYGRKYMGVVRTTYILSEDGTIIYANDKVKAKEDPLNILEIL